MPKVSIILSVYNGAATLADALETTLYQTFQDFELIAVDDGSTDDTLALLHQYARRDRRIHILQNERNLGVANSLNRGVRAARGEYIMRMDADDLNLADRLERQVDILETHPQIGLVSCYADLLFSPEKDAALRAYLWEWERWRRRIAHVPSKISEVLPRRCTFHHGEVVYRKQIWMEVGGYRPVFAFAEDYDLWLRMLGRTSFYIVPQTLYIRRYDSSSTSSVSSDLHRLFGRLARECYQLRAAGSDDSEHAHARALQLLEMHGVAEQLAPRIATLLDVPSDLVQRVS